MDAKRRTLLEALRSLRKSSLEHLQPRALYVTCVLAQRDCRVNPVDQVSSPSHATDWFALNATRAISDITISTGRTLRKEQDTLDPRLCSTFDQLLIETFPHDKNALEHWRDWIAANDAHRQLAILSQGLEPLPWTQRYFKSAQMDARAITIGVPESARSSLVRMLPVASANDLSVLGLQSPAGIGGFVSKLNERFVSRSSAGRTAAPVIGIEAGPQSSMNCRSGFFSEHFPANVHRSVLLTTFHGSIEDSVLTFDPPVRFPEKDFDELVSFEWDSPAGRWSLRLLDEI